MKDLIKALTILSKYIADGDSPTHCEHDVLTVMVDPGIVSLRDIDQLKELGFIPQLDDCVFISFRYGSA